MMSVKSSDYEGLLCQYSSRERAIVLLRQYRSYLKPLAHNSNQEVIMQVSSETFHEVAQYLDRHEESLRIKKLIFCICQKYWENDSNILTSVSFEDLLQLTFSIYKLVKTLNRPKVYASVTKVIIEQVGRLYQSSTSYDTELLPVSSSPHPVFPYHPN